MKENLKAEILFDETLKDRWVEFYIGGVKFISETIAMEKAIIVCEQLNHVFDKYKRD